MYSKNKLKIKAFCAILSAILLVSPLVASAANILWLQESNDPASTPDGLATSSNGSVVAVSTGTYIWIGTGCVSGQCSTWTQQTALYNATATLGAAEPLGVGLSGDGKMAVVGDYHTYSGTGYIWIGTGCNTGTCTWTRQTSAGAAVWVNPSVSTDGTAVVVGTGEYIAVGSNCSETLGTCTWTLVTSLPQDDYYSTAISSNGTVMLVGEAQGQGLFLASCGAGGVSCTWTAASGVSGIPFSGVSLSPDGTTILAGNTSSGYLYLASGCTPGTWTCTTPLTTQTALGSAGSWRSSVIAGNSGPMMASDIANDYTWIGTNCSLGTCTWTKQTSLNGLPFNYNGDAITSNGQTFMAAGTSLWVGILPAFAKVVQFVAGNTFTISNAFSATGNNGSLVKLMSTVPPTTTSTGTPWNLNVSAAPTANNSVSYADVQDSACTGTATHNIIATNSVDDGDNSLNTGTDASPVGGCWTFGTPYIDMTMNSNAVDFGALSLGNVNYGTLGTGSGGTATDPADPTTTLPSTVLHQITVGTNAPNGYNIYVQGAPLSNGTYTFATNAIATAPAAGTESFGLRVDPIQLVGTYGGSGVTIPVKYGTAGEFAFPTSSSTPDIIAQSVSPSGANLLRSTTYDVHYVASMAAATPQGQYSTTLTYIVVGDF